MNLFKVVFVSSNPLGNVLAGFPVTCPTVGKKTVYELTGGFFAIRCTFTFRNAFKFFYFYFSTSISLK